MSFALILSAFSNVPGQTGQAAPKSALLYEVTGNDLKKPSYLFGTVHIICEKDMFASEKMQSYIDQTGQILLEFE